MHSRTRTATYDPRAARTKAALVAALALVLAALSGLTFGQNDAPEQDAQDTEQTIVAEVGDRSVTLAEFDDRFDTAVRAAAMSQGVPLTDDALSQFDAQRGAYLQELATQLVLLREAEDRGITVSDQQLDERIEAFRAQFEEEAAFQARVEELGFDDTEALRANVRESLTLQALVEAIASDISPSEEELRTFFEANPERFATPDGEAQFADARAQIEQVYVQQEVSERIEDIRAEADVQTYPENL